MHLVMEMVQAVMVMVVMATAAAQAVAMIDLPLKFTQNVAF
jgi:hypothetical protein